MKKEHLKCLLDFARNIVNKMDFNVFDTTKMDSSEILIGKKENYAKTKKQGRANYGFKCKLSKIAYYD